MKTSSVPTYCEGIHTYLPAQTEKSKLIFFQRARVANSTSSFNEDSGACCWSIALGSSYMMFAPRSANPCCQKRLQQTRLFRVSMRLHRQFLQHYKATVTLHKNTPSCRDSARQLCLVNQSEDVAVAQTDINMFHKDALVGHCFGFVIYDVRSSLA